MYATQPDPRGATYYIFTDRNFSNRGNALEFLKLKVEAARQAQKDNPGKESEHDA